MHQIILASHNQGKINEFQTIFKQFDIKVTPQSDFNIPEIDEPYLTFVENALHKARFCSKITGLPALSDDSGLCVPALLGSPGVISARYAGSPCNSENNINKLLRELQGIKERNAYFYCVLVLIRHTNDPRPLIADGTINGVISNTKMGSNGFGYDPIFYLPNYDKTMAQLESIIKNQISHRALAIKNLISKLQAQNFDNFGFNHN